LFVFLADLLEGGAGDASIFRNPSSKLNPFAVMPDDFGIKQRYQK
jgi:hypothetical protein